MIAFVLDVGKLSEGNQDICSRGNHHLSFSSLMAIQESSRVCAACSGGARSRTILISSAEAIKITHDFEGVAGGGGGGGGWLIV